MLNVEQFRYDADNFGYLIYGRREAIAVDGGARREILDFMQAAGLSLTIVTNTHGHFDHTCGNEELLSSTKTKFFGFNELADNKEILIDGEKVSVYRTPGHTADSVCFLAGNALISGDTLFNGTIGNCFTGDLKSFYLSIKRLMTLPDETVIYAGHDYIRDSLAFARRLEPGNKDIDAFLNFYDPHNVCSTMADERRINPYLRFNEDPIIKILEKRGLPRATEWERWTSLMSIE
jgi:hydroxyacylglutathione hydrolase